jgi:predicted negative regulator of RcsB-dependent stress response
MQRLRAVIGFLGPVLVIGCLLAFVGYALWLYQPDQTASCQKTGPSQQFDVAVHVVRQWSGKENQMYLTCPGQ